MWTNEEKSNFFSNFRIPVFLYLGERYFTDPIVDAEEENQETVDSFFSSAETNFDDEKRAMYAARRKSKSENITFLCSVKDAFSSFLFVLYSSLSFFLALDFLSFSFLFFSFLWSLISRISANQPEIVKLALPEKSKFSLNNW